MALSLLFRYVDVLLQFPCQFVDQGRLHWFVDVFDEEGDDLLGAKLLPELLSYLVRVVLLHDEDEICPTDVAFREPYSRPFVGSSRSDLISIELLVDLLRSVASVFVDAADEEDLRWGLLIHPFGQRRAMRSAAFAPGRIVPRRLC